jgi:2-haloacid dehalogenase
LQYTWLRSLQNRHADFWQITGDALDFAMASLEIADNGLRDRLMQLYLRLSAFPEVRGVLEALKAADMKCAILSNGSPDMLAAAVDNAGIGDLLDAVLSVEEVGIYKPHPKVYALAEERLGLPAGRMSFQSSNAWDAYAAKAYGYRVVWCNRYGQETERLPGEPDAQVRSLDELLPILGLAAS